MSKKPAFKDSELPGAGAKKGGPKMPVAKNAPPKGGSAKAGAKRGGPKMPVAKNAPPKTK